MSRPLTVLLLLAAIGSAQTADEVKQTVDGLKAAFRTKDEVVIDKAIRQSTKINDAAVSKAIAKGLRNRSLAVREASIDALGSMDNETALKELQRLYFGDRSLSKNPKLFALLLKSIGRHGDPSSIRVMIDSPFNRLTLESGKARLMGLGNIRDPKSIEEMVKLTRKATGKQRGTGVTSEWRGAFTEAFHDSFVVLTGQDYGRGNDQLEKWWRDNKKDLKIAPERPKVPDEVSRRWAAYWQKNYYKDAKKAPPPRTFNAPIMIVENPTPEQESQAVANLKDAYKSKDPDTIADALQRYGGTVSSRVVHEVARGLRYKDPKVRMVAVQALGWMPTDDALKQLHRMYRREKKLGKQDEALFAELLKEIGRHGDKSSITVLSNKPFKYHTLASSRARIYGLGNIRVKASIETLIKGLMQSGTSGTRDARSFKQYQPRAMPEFNVALTVLSGESMGEQKDAWLTWWREMKKKFKISPERPPVADDIRRKWEAYWHEKY